MEADGPANMKTRERTEGAATVVQAKHGGSCSAHRVDLDPICSTSFDDDCTRLPALSCSGDGAAAPKSCLLILGDALTNSRWWLTSQRRSLYSHEDHFQPATSSALLDRGDKFYFDFINSRSCQLISIIL